MGTTTHTDNNHNELGLGLIPNDSKRTETTETKHDETSKRNEKAQRNHETKQNAPDKDPIPKTTGKKKDHQQPTFKEPGAAFIYTIFGRNALLLP